ncbi:unnamed protein product, partial [Didymodactylos carnosus]
MEHLPDELWVLIFRYLHRIDILHSFSQLSSRFQQILQSYYENMNLINVSYRHYKILCEQILPLHGSQVRSLILHNSLQLNKFKEHIKQLPHLQYLKLTSDYDDEDSIHEIEYYVDRLPQYLTDLHIDGCFVLSSILMKVLGGKAEVPEFPSLTNLTVLGSYAFEQPISQSDWHCLCMHRNLKTLKIHLTILEDIFCILPSMPNLEELYLSSLLNVIEFEDEKKMNGFRTVARSISSKLLKFHFETGRLHQEPNDSCR